MTQRQGAPGIEPGTSRSAVECSTTELYPLREDGKRFSHVITLHLSSHHRTPSSAFSPAPALTTGLTLIAHTHTHTRARARSRTHQADTASAACACIQHSFVRMHVPASSVCLVLSRTRQAHGVLAQMVERSLSMREVLGSMPRYSISQQSPLSFTLSVAPCAQNLNRSAHCHPEHVVGRHGTHKFSTITTASSRPSPFWSHFVTNARC